MKKYYAEIENNSKTHPVFVNANLTFDALAQLHEDYKFDKLICFSEKPIKYRKERLTPSINAQFISHFSGNKTSKVYAVAEV